MARKPTKPPDDSAVGVAGSGGHTDTADVVVTAGSGGGERIDAQMGASAAPAPPQSSGATSRPRQVAGKYPMRQVTYYQFNTSDIRSIGIAQAAATLFAALGTFALSLYLDYSKDITLAVEQKQNVPQFLHDVANISFWAWIAFWVLALLAFIYQRNELGRIKTEHGEPTLRQRINSWWSNHGAR